MSNIEKKLPQPGQQNWGNTLNKAIKDIDLGVEELRDRLDTEKIIAPRMFLSTGVVGEYGSEKNYFKKADGGLIEGEIDFASVISFNFDCYFSDTGKGESAQILFTGEIPFNIVDSFTLSVGEMRFYPVYIFYDNGNPSIVTKAEGAESSEILSFSDIMVSHPWYIYIGAIKGINNAGSIGFTFIPQVSLSNQTAIEKMNSLMNPRIAVGDLEIEYDAGFDIKSGGFIKYLFMSAGIGYASSNEAMRKNDEKLCIYESGLPTYDIFNFGNMGYSGAYRILLGNNKTILFQESELIIAPPSPGQSPDEPTLRNAKFPVLEPSMVFGGYIEVGRFYITRTSTIYKTLDGSLPAMAGAAVSLASDNTLEETKFTLFNNVGEYYQLEGVGSTLSGDKTNPTKFKLNEEWGTDILTGSNQPTLFLIPKSLLLDTTFGKATVGEGFVEVEGTISNKIRMQADTSGQFLSFGNFVFFENPVGTFLVNRAGNNYLTFNSNLFKVHTNIEALSYNATSDVRLKENLQPLMPSALSGLPLYAFTFKNDPASKQHVGILAQDLLEVAPELVEERDGFYSIKESKLVYYLMNEVKNLTSTVTNLEKRLTILEEQINENKKDK